MTSGDLWREWQELDRLLGEVDEQARKEVGVNAAYEARRDELQAPIFRRFNEIEAKIASMVLTTIGDFLLPLHLLKIRREYLLEPDELDDQLVDNLIAGVEVMAAAGG